MKHSGARSAPDFRDIRTPKVAQTIGNDAFRRAGRAGKLGIWTPKVAKILQNEAFLSRGHVKTTLKSIEKIGKTKIPDF